MKNIAQMMKQAQQMQSKMTSLQAELDKFEATGSAGSGMVSVTVNGKGNLVELKIDPSVAGDADMLEALIMAAFNDAKEKVDTHLSTEMKKISGGLNLPF